ncbi:MAG: hypothetical protein ACFFG0_03895 [Candidatus Thorarchaeota archaeon]
MRKPCEGCTFNNSSLSCLRACVMNGIEDFNKNCICSYCIIKANCTVVCEERSLQYRNYIKSNNKLVREDNLFSKLFRGVLLLQD